ncbi:MAG: hypothetical protein ISR64_03545 [Deltaproteobacteria bacterium]|nr:hypothetical protein [Deltaproteobacteria bacterium]
MPARIFTLTTLLFLALSCGSGDGPCKDDYDCDGLEVCNVPAGKCEPVICQADDDCIDPRYECLDNRCVLKQGTVSE